MRRKRTGADRKRPTPINHQRQYSIIENVCLALEYIGIVALIIGAYKNRDVMMVGAGIGVAATIMYAIIDSNK